MATFTFILRACPDAAKAAIALLLGKAFSLKDSTCASIADSAPIVLLPDLTLEEAAAMHLVLSGFARLGAEVEFATSTPDELPKIDWPRRPQVFKRDVADYLADYQLQVPVGNGRETLISLLVKAFPITGASSVQPVLSNPAPAPVPTRSPTPPPVAQPAARPTGGEFRGIQLPEITPFGGVATLPSAPASKPSTAQASKAAAAATSGNDDTLARLNELFPEEESSGFIPNNQDITSILNRLLPDEEGSGSTTPAASASGRRSAVSGVNGSGSGGHQVVGGWAVFLAKIADEGRRQKAVPLIAEMARISPEEADALSKKVIIPVLKGADQAQAEAAKQKFAKIGILARVKGPE